MTKNVVYVIGAVALLVGIAGFFSNSVVGLFEVDSVHSVILGIIGLALLASAATGNENMGAKAGGVVLAIIAVLGFVPPTTTVIGIADTNVASSVLQAVMAIALLYCGFAGGKEGSDEASPMPPSTPSAPGAPGTPGGGGQV